MCRPAVLVSTDEHFKRRSDMHAALTTDRSQELLSNGVNARDPMHVVAVVQYCNTSFLVIHVDEIKCYEGGHFTLEGDSLIVRGTLVQNVRGDTVR